MMNLWSCNFLKNPYINTFHVLAYTVLLEPAHSAVGLLIFHIVIWTDSKRYVGPILIQHISDSSCTPTVLGIRRKLIYSHKNIATTTNTDKLSNRNIPKYVCNFLILHTFTSEAWDTIYIQFCLLCTFNDNFNHRVTYYLVVYIMFRAA